MGLFYARVFHRPAGISIWAGSNLKHIRSDAVAEGGRGSVRDVRWATQEDVDYVRNAGGHIPLGGEIKPE